MTVFTSACCRSAERSGASGQTVATTLRGGALSRRERSAVRRRQTTTEPYEYFLRGRQSLHRMQQPDMDDSRQMFERAIALDADYAPAWAGLATVHALLFEWWGARDADLQRADQAGKDTGLFLDFAQGGMGSVYLCRHKELPHLRKVLKVIATHPARFEAQGAEPGTILAADSNGVGRPTASSLGRGSGVRATPLPTCASFGARSCSSSMSSNSDGSIACAAATASSISRKLDGR